MPSDLEETPGKGDGGKEEMHFIGPYAFRNRFTTNGVCELSLHFIKARDELISLLFYLQLCAR